MRGFMTIHVHSTHLGFKFCAYKAICNPLESVHNDSHIWSRFTCCGHSIENEANAMQPLRKTLHWL